MAFKKRMRVLLGVLIGLSTQSFAATATLELKIIDAATKAPTQARMHVIDASGQFAVADDAVRFGGDCNMSDAGAGYTTHAAALAGFQNKLTNPYTGTTQFYVDGTATVTVPAGQVEILVQKGPEYQPVRLQLHPLSGDSVAHTIALDRWVNMPARGWYSADDHIHIQRPHPDLNPRIIQQMQAEDIHVANLLQMGKVLNFEIAPQYQFGKGGHYQIGNHILAAGQENPRTHYLGHTITLGASEPVFDGEEYLIYRKIWERTIELGGINGFAHAFATSGGVTPYTGSAVVLPHNLLHFLEVLQFNRGGYQVWYDILNLGHRVAATAGTDYPCADQPIPGHERFYTRVEGELNYAKWLAAVKAGRTFVTTGPVLEFQVEDQGIGGDVSLPVPGKVRVRGSVHFNPITDGFGVLQLIQNGDVIAEIPNVDGRDKMALDMELHMERSGWLALRASGTERSFSGFSQPFHFSMLQSTSNAHSSPIYIEVQGTPGIAASQKGKAVARAFVARLDGLEATLKESNLQSLGALLEVPEFDAVPTEVLVSNREALLEEIATARRYYSELLLRGVPSAESKLGEVRR